MGRATKLFSILVTALLPLLAAAPAPAQTCGADYVIQEGDSLAKIAGRVYGKTSQWTVIFYANQDRLGGGTSLIVPGLAVRIPCIGGAEPALPAAATTEAAAPSAPTKIETASITKKIQFLTADDYAPFTGRALPNGGMHPDIISSAMELLKTESGGKVDFAINWVNDWSAHLNPLLVTRAFDMGFPWYQPDCQDFANLDSDAKFRCQKFFFSDPVYEELSLLFVKKESTITFETDQELLGKSICRPAGYFTFDLDQNGRNWVKDKKITLLQPQAIEECFRLLMEGSADAVALTELTGRAGVIKLDLSDKVRVIDRPLGVLADHIIIAKTHPNARVLLHYVNAALAKLKSEGRFDEIVEKHLTLFWESQTSDKPAAPTASTEPSAEATDGSDATATATATTSQ
ncbi:MAG: transporter substrate-binding domain-containing protein [Hyphomicrobiaceae bacterium]